MMVLVVMVMTAALLIMMVLLLNLSQQLLHHRIRFFNQSQQLTTCKLLHRSCHNRCTAVVSAQQFHICLHLPGICHIRPA